MSGLCKEEELTFMCRMKNDSNRLAELKTITMNFWSHSICLKLTLSEGEASHYYSTGLADCSKYCHTAFASASQKTRGVLLEAPAM